MPGSPSPTVAHHRAVVSGLSRCVKTGERAADDPQLIDARRNLAAARLAEYIERTVAAAPAFTPEQVDRLRVLLEPARLDLTDAAMRPYGGGPDAI
ncbi:MAG TPA: hypothetical protein VNY55_08320 [Mycobacterium sp.]|jgi:hypothetical protein|nr:hypothetical protein [Mycobacterium sp.]